MEVTDEMWDAALENFYNKLPDTVGLSAEKRDTIRDLLLNWDKDSAMERKVKSNGNHIYWHSKYMVAIAGEEDPRLCYKLEDTGEDDLTKLQFVSSREEFFQHIKAVHIASESRLDSNRFPFFSNVRPFVLSENHNKDISLYKACQLKYGSSIPRCATNLFVKSCPICISHVHLKKKKVAGFQPIITKGFGKRGQVCLVLVLIFSNVVRCRYV
jgi:hypothetical protein